jgi:hypothetical protein
MSVGEYQSLAGQIKQLCEAVTQLQRDAVELGIGVDVRASNWHRGLFQHLRPRVEGQPYLLVAVVGGTNTGKSMIFNQLAGSKASRVSHIACRTRHPVCLAPRDFLRNCLPQQVFPGFQLRPWQSEDDAVAEGPDGMLFLREDLQGKQPANLLLLDTPDIDGCLQEHWDRAQLVRQAADVLVGVLTAQKYNDEAVRRFFCEAVAADKPVVLVFNMVDWPEKREACADWLRDFCSSTGVDPLHVYAAPHDEKAGMDLRLAFHALSAGSTDLRTDLADLQFGAIKLRTFRGALRQVLDRDDGLDRFLVSVRAQSAEYEKAASVIEKTTCTSIAMPALPGHVIVNELWNWLEPRRTRFDVWVHRVLSYPGRVLMQRFRTDPAKLEAEYHEKEMEALLRGLEHVVGTLENIENVGNEVVKKEIRELLGGISREQMFAEVRRRYQAVPLVSDSYREFIHTELDNFAQANKKTLVAMQSFLVATAVVRPAITIALLGGPAILHEVAHHAAAQTVVEGGRIVAEQASMYTAAQVVGDVAVGAACGVSGNVAVTGGAAIGLRELIARISAAFYIGRAKVLAGIVNEGLCGDKLRRIRRLAQVKDGQPLRSAQEIVERLRACLQADGRAGG